MDFKRINVVVLAMAMLVGVGVGGLRPQATRCKYSHKYSKYTADCVGLDLTLIPDSLNEDIQILVASENRIRELHNTSFMAYGSLQFLYLSNNFITYIEPGTFNAVPKLEVLDLGVNGLRAIPAELPLPLRRLYLNGNRQIDSVPLTNAFNLQYLSLAECHLSRLPNVGQLPNLLEMNLTGNSLTAISAEQLAPLCRLKTIHTSSAAEMGHYGYGPSKESTCQCHEFSYWTNKYSIHTSHQPNCTELSDVEHELCLTNRSGWYDMRQSCLARTPPFSLTSTSVMTSVGLALLCAVMVVLCCLWRRSRRKRKPAAVNSSMKDDRNLTKISTVV